MIPAVGENIVNFVAAEAPSKSYRLDLTARHMRGVTDQREAMKQAIYLIVYTERYKYPIYSWNYGAELEELIGKPVAYAIPEIKRRVTEALMQDDRINGVDGWVFDVKRGIVSATYTVHTVYGDIDAEVKL